MTSIIFKDYFLNLNFVVFVLIVSLVFFIGTLLGKYMEKIRTAKQVKKERYDAVKRSRAVLNGVLKEQLAPFFPDFPADPTEIRFIGKPIDYIAFNGASQGKVSSISFIEIKTGKAKLNLVEKSIKEAILNGNINYREYRLK